MRVTYLPEPLAARRGITLLEVLISIGILAIGLTSVMSLIPAGKSEAAKAIVYDRAASMAVNALSDAISFGLTRPDSYVATASNATTIVFDDPAVVIPWPSVASAAMFKAAGVLAAGSDTTTASFEVVKLVLHGRDDVTYNPPPTADDLPTNAFINGIRGFDGRTTTLIALTEADGGTPPLAAGDRATLSVIVFHNRDTSATTASGTMDASGLVTLTSLPTGRSLKSVMRPGTVLFYVDPITPRLRFAQLSMAAVDALTGDTYVAFIGRPGPGAPVSVTVLVDSVGLAEQAITLEGSNPYAK